MLAIIIAGLPSSAVAQQLFFQPHHQTPVGFEPGDLLTIPGAGFATKPQVIYQRLTGATIPAPPSSLPAVNTADLGVLQVVAAASGEDAITVRAATQLIKDVTYAVRVRNPRGAWTQPLLLNDARPLWSTPARVYATQSFAAGMPRVLKVVGRNLRPSPGATTKVRLIGPSTVTLTAANDGNEATKVENFAARVVLPSLPVGAYQVQVSRDGQAWVPVADGSLFVVPDPRYKAVLPVSNFAQPGSPCQPDDNIDDTGCIVRAVAAAPASVPSVVTFGRGRWDVNFEGAAYNSWQWGHDGILVPSGVSLRGAGRDLTTIVKTLPQPVPATWSGQFAVFTLFGNQSVTGIHFDDALRGTTDTNMLRLGRMAHASPAGAREVDDVTIADCRFSRMSTAIGSTIQVNRLVIVRNILNAHMINIFISPTSAPATHNLVAQDSVVAENTFLPGGFNDPQQQSGTMTGAFGGSTRLDVSDNVADGFLNGGWGAGFFWHEGFNHEKLLVASNRLSCTGEKSHDGPALAFDANYHESAFAGLAPITAARSRSATFTAQLTNTDPGYYNGFWLQVVKGKGLGQSRKIVSYRRTGNSVTANVSPAWDVLPDPASSKVMVGEAYWQVIVVDNIVDNRSPISREQGCAHNNPNSEEPGIIGFYGNTIDSSIWGNRLLGTGGISLGVPAHFGGHSTGCGTSFPNGDGLKRAWFSYFVDARYNLIDRSVSPEIKPIRLGGITAWFSSHDASESAVLARGLAVSRNTVTRSTTDWLFSGNCDGDHRFLGAIGFDGYNNAVRNPRIVRDLVVSMNRINDVSQGIYFGSAPIYKAVLDKNVFSSVPTPVFDAGTATVKLP